MEDADVALVVIPLLAVLAPLLTRGLGRWVRIPVVVFELMLGIVAGPSLLGWVHPNEFIDRIANLGLAMLFFVAGTEIQTSALRGRTGRNATLGWLVSLVVGVGLGWLIAPGEAAVILGVAMASTALGTLLPILRDARELDTPFGHSVSALGAVGEFGPLIAISVFLGTRSPGAASVVLAVFAVVAGLAIWYGIRGPHGALHKFVNATLHTSGQFAIRVVFLLLAALLALSLALEVDFLLGAFVAGLVWRLLIRDAKREDQEAVESKVEAIAFGFLVPVFFINTGVSFDLAALLADPRLLVVLVVGFVALFVVRGVPSMLAAPVGASRRERTSIGLMGATGLPIIVAVTAIGVSEGFLTTGLAAALVGAGMLSVLVFPLVAMSLRGGVPVATALADDEV
ncbi:cation:proton antiporter [Occultella kanbiaonis]|uniref:cation:proton antiporter n=1 Tax=Occultella kanbiaonis TaxID=2675754 RepID=UPI0013D27793|nr:cation:proton antiporter [Occultella kanbiaonis]